MNHPIFVVIDGIDGTGKSTQVHLLAEWLRESGRQTKITQEPGGTAAGTIIRTILLNKTMTLEQNTELLLFCADRAEHQQKIISTLQQGESIVCDRFLSSTYAYQIFGRKMKPDILETVSAHIIKRYPDLTIILDMDINIALERAKSRLKKDGKEETEGRFEAEHREFFIDVQKGFRWYAEQKQFGKCVLVDANGSIEDVHKKIKHLADKL